MHPILATRRRLALYLAAWIPVSALLAALAWASGSAPPTDAVAQIVPACFVFAFLCLSPWYICRTRPLRVAVAPGLALTFSAAATVASLILTACVQAMAAILQRPALPWAPLFGMGIAIYLLSAGLHYALLAAEASREAERVAAQARTLAREAELIALRTQLNPHFLFNSLHSISALAGLDAMRARDMSIRLADFLRNSLRLGALDTISLGDELALARSYLAVEQVRFGDRLRLEEDIDTAAVNCGVPALLLQPLIENAVKHGVAGLVEGGCISLNARRTGQGVAVRIENAFDADAPGGGTGIGLAHVRKRLEVRYGAAASLEARAEDGLYRVDLRLPCDSPMASSSRA